MLNRGVEGTYACPTLHGRVCSHECWPEWVRLCLPAPHCTVGFTATNADPRRSRRRMPAPHCTVTFTATNAGPRVGGDICLPHTARSGSQQRCWPEAVEATYACPTLQGRVHSNDCWPESWRRRKPAPHCTVGFAATIAGPRRSRRRMPAPHCTVGFAVMNAGPNG